MTCAAYGHRCAKRGDRAAPDSSRAHPVTKMVHIVWKNRWMCSWAVTTNRLGWELELISFYLLSLENTKSTNEETCTKLNIVYKIRTTIFARRPSVCLWGNKQTLGCLFVSLHRSTASKNCRVAWLSGQRSSSKTLVADASDSHRGLFHGKMSLTRQFWPKIKLRSVLARKKNTERNIDQKIILIIKTSDIYSKLFS